MTSKMSLLPIVALLVACGGGTTNTVPDQDASTPTPPTPTTPPTAAPAPSVPVADAGADGAADGSVEGGAPGTYCDFRTKSCKKSAAQCAEEVKCLNALRPGVSAAVQSCVETCAVQANVTRILFEGRDIERFLILEK